MKFGFNLGELRGFHKKTLSICNEVLYKEYSNKKSIEKALEFLEESLCLDKLLLPEEYYYLKKRELEEFYKRNNLKKSNDKFLSLISRINLVNFNRPY